MRIDKYIWAIRLFKTRTLSSKACADEKVKLNGVFIKQSKVVNINDEIAIKVIPIWRTYKVLDIPKSRLGAISSLRQSNSPSAYARPRRHDIHSGRLVAHDARLGPFNFCRHRFGKCLQLASVEVRRCRAGQGQVFFVGADRHTIRSVEPA